MTTDRCPACNAAVTAGAQWCTLCYTVLRQPEPVAATPAAVAAPAAADPIAAYGTSMGAQPRLTPDLTEAPLPPDPILDAPVLQAPPVARQRSEGWPCLSCGALVPLADDACSQCGQPFLPTDATPSLALPGVGDISRLDRGQKIVVLVLLALAVTGALVGLAFVAGSMV